MSPNGILEPERWPILLYFVGALTGFVAIGVLASVKRQQTTSDYLLAGRTVPPVLVALSSVATLSSGFMFIGQIGLTYRMGLSSMWWLVGWTIGDLLAWIFVYPKVRRWSEERGEMSALALFAPRSRVGRSPLLTVAALLTVFYLAMYAAAQLKAGSLALESIFGMPTNLGAVLGAAIVVAYCYAGGIRASIWTDAAQSLVMIASMAVLAVVASREVGGPAALMKGLASIGPEMAHVFPADLRFGFLIYLAGMVFGGLGVIGQPHILVRTMTLRDAREIPRARFYYFLWLIPFYVLAIWVGLHARVLLPGLMESSAATTEQALPLLSIELLPDVLIGLMLAGLFSATMSTADSQIIACTNAVTQDLQPRWADSYAASKGTTLVVTGLALTIAVNSSAGVFRLVLDAWAVLSCSLGPLVLLRLLGLPCSERVGIALVAVGLVVSNGWVLSEYAADTYVNLPGMLAVLATYGLIRVAQRSQNA